MEWFENEEFWRDLYPFMFPPERFSAAGEQVDQIVKLTGFEGRTVLDLCCGPGRHSVAFAQRGYEVTGVDRSRFLLDRAGALAGETGVSVEWVMQDMRAFRRPSKFDLVCNLFTSFGYFADEADNLQVLRNVHENLKSGGVFVIELLGKERLARVWKDAICTEYAEGALLLQRPQVQAGWTRISNEWRLLKDGRYQVFNFDHAIYSGRELKDRLVSCGFAEVQLFGDVQGAPYGLDATRLVVLARKGLASGSV